MRLILAVSLILCLLFSLPACTPTAPRDPFAYAAAPFSVTVEGTYLPTSDEGGTPRPFAARIAEKYGLSYRELVGNPSQA